MLPAGLVNIMEYDKAPQIRAAAAAAAAALVKNAPLRMWMPLAARGEGAGVGRSIGGIEQRVASMMYQLQMTLVSCLAREEVCVCVFVCVQ